MQTETLDKLYLEWSQFTQAKTAKELALEAALSAKDAAHAIALAEAVAEFEQALAVACMLAEISDSKYESLMIYLRKARGAAHD